jgi:alcohol dehydrogenase class IV
MQWVSASKPVAAVTRGGIETVSSGSRMAATGRKTVIFSPHLLAKAAILDPELTVSMPPRVTAATGFDALTHCIEAYCSVGDHPMADAIAIGGIELCAKYLVRAVQKGDDLEARGGMMKAAMMGAVSFQKGLGACHSLAHPLSSEKNLHHGLANALCLPAVIEHNEKTIPEKMDRIRQILDPKAKSLADALRDLRKKTDIAKLSEKAFEDACHRCNPKPVTKDDLAALYRASL